jgi:hypothetical protein
MHMYAHPRTHLTTRRPAPRLVLFACLFLSACSSLTETDTIFNRYGAITITGQNAAAARATATVTAVFFEGLSASAPNSALEQGDQCQFAFLDSSRTGSVGSLVVGDNLAMTFAGTVVPMPYSTALLRYQPASGTVLTYGAGDAATISIPGSGALFPATTISVKLAEPIVPGPVVVPATGAPMDVTWNPTSDATAGVILSLRYGATATATSANEQVYCTLKDDGDFQVPASGLGPFLSSPPALRSLALIRWRTNEVRPNATTLVHIVSTVDTIVRFP